MINSDRSCLRQYLDLPQICSDKVLSAIYVSCASSLTIVKNKPNGQFKLGFDPQSIKAFMHDLSIRKVPGVGRVNERLLDSIGIKVQIPFHRVIQITHMSNI